MKDDLPPIDPADEEELRSATALARALDGGPSDPDLPQAALETAALLRLSAGKGRLGEERAAAIRSALLEGLARAPRQTAPAGRGGRFALPRWLVIGFPLTGAAALALLVLLREPQPNAELGPATLGPASADPATAGPATPYPATAGPESREQEVLGAGRSAERSLAAGERSDGARLQASPRLETGAELRPDGFASGAPGSGAIASHARAAKGSAANADGITGAQDEGARRALVGLASEVNERRAELLARVNDARLSGAHAQLDAAKRPEELERSQAALRSALDTLGADLDPTDARRVRQDLYCRLAETTLRLGEPRAALEWVQRGLDLDGPPTPFLAQLLALQGDAWAALGDDSSAAASYMRALRVHETLLEESLDGR